MEYVSHLYQQSAFLWNYIIIIPLYPSKLWNYQGNSWNIMEYDGILIYIIWPVTVVELTLEEKQPNQVRYQLTTWWWFTPVNEL